MCVCVCVCFSVHDTCVHICAKITTTTTTKRLIKNTCECDVALICLETCSGELVVPMSVAN